MNILCGYSQAFQAWKVRKKLRRIFYSCDCACAFSGGLWIKKKTGNVGSREPDPSPNLQTWIFLTNYLFSSRLHSSAGPWETYWLQLSENPPLKEQQEAQSAHKLTQDLCWVPDRQLCQKKPFKKKKKASTKSPIFFLFIKLPECCCARSSASVPDPGAPFASRLVELKFTDNWELLFWHLGI